MSNFAIQNHT